MSNEIIGLTREQFRDLSAMYAASRITKRGAGNGAAKVLSTSARVIALTARSAYNSLTTEDLPVFSFSHDRQVWNLIITGSSVSGYFVLQVLGQEFTVDCRRTHLDDIVEVIGPQLRATVFPGMWEFEFLVELDTETPVDWRTLTLEEDQTLCELFDEEDKPVFTASVLTRQEGWVSDSLPTGVILKEPVRDAIPYDSGSIAAGSIGQCIWHHDAGWSAIAWECRDFSIAGEWTEADDPYYPAVAL